MSSEPLSAEEPLNLMYLDHAPAQAARWHLDAHVPLGLVRCTLLCAGAWHWLHNPVLAPIDKTAREDLLFAHVVPPALQRQAQPWPSNPDALYVVKTGDPPYWALGGQRIPSPSRLDCPFAEWTRASAGNYRWAWALGLALALEYKHRYKRVHPYTYMLWALEPTPPALSGEQAEPVPVMPEDCKVVNEGYYDCVASYQLYYRTYKQEFHSWTARKPPPWIAEGGA